MPVVRRIGPSGRTGSSGKTSVATRNRPASASAASAAKSARAARLSKTSIAPSGIHDRACTAGFADAGADLGYVHLSESNRGVPGRGTLDWDEVFTSLAEIGYSGSMTLESFVYLAPEIATGLSVWWPVAERPKDVIDVGLPFVAERAAAAGLKLER